MHNPSLREEPLDQKPTPIPARPQDSILNWLESTGRLLARDTNDRDLLNDDEEMEEINELMVADDVSDFDDDDDELELED